MVIINDDVVRKECNFDIYKLYNYLYSRNFNYLVDIVDYKKASDSIISPGIVPGTKTILPSIWPIPSPLWFNLVIFTCMVTPSFSNIFNDIVINLNEG